jgi:hypothetical protein
VDFDSANRRERILSLPAKTANDRQLKSIGNQTKLIKDFETTTFEKIKKLFYHERINDGLSANDEYHS